MAKTLIICEKPSVARDVADALAGTFTEKSGLYESDEWVIGYAIGHLVEQADPDEYDAKYKKWRYEDLPIVPDRFVYEARDAKADKQLKSLHRAMKRKDVERIVNACDAGREGELIFKLIAETAGVDKPIERAWFSSMTQKAIRDAFAHLRPDAELKPLEAAARSRSEADWLVGMNATRAATTKTSSLRSIISLGRVQTPTLALIARRDEEILAFLPEDYWQVEARFETAAGARYAGRHHGQTKPADRVASAEAAERIRAAVDGKTGEITAVERKPKTEESPLLYDLTALQREANNRHGFSATRTLRAAQALYETHKALTYPRTSSRFLPSDLIPTLGAVAAQVGKAAPEYAEAAAYVAGLDILPTARIVNDAKVGDHHAIIPTDGPHRLRSFGSDEQKIYDMVARRFLAVFHKPSVKELTTVWTEVAGERFRSSGTVLVVAGWRGVYGERAGVVRAPAEGEEPEEQLPALEQGEAATAREVEVLAKQTKPPARFSEATLLRAMETAGRLVEDDEAAEAMKESGLGTPATRAATIETLVDRGYIEREGKSLRATDKGLAVIRMLGDHDLTKADLTGDWEKRLVDIEHGRGSAEEFMRDIRGFTERTVAWFADKDRAAMKVQRTPLGACPLCHAEGREESIVEYPKSFGCTSWKSKEEPGCGFTIWKRQSGRTVSAGDVRELLARVSTPAELERELAALVPPRVDLGPCPICSLQGKDEVIRENSKAFGCSSWKSKTETGCGYVIWKRQGGKDVGVEEARAKVEADRVRAAAGENVLPEPSVRGARGGREAIGPCPRCKAAGRDEQIVENSRAFGCSSWKSRKNAGCGFVIWKRQRGSDHEVDAAEAKRMLEYALANGLTDPPEPGAVKTTAA